MKNLTEVLSLHAPGRICILDRGKTWSYGDVFALVRWHSASLHAQGIRARDVVALTFRDEFASLICQLAVARLGATVLTLSMTTPAARRRELMRTTAAKWIVGDSRLGDSDEWPFLPFPADLDGVCHEFTGQDVFDAAPQAPWVIVPGSGSTGLPKLMPVSHAQQINRMRVGLKWLPYDDADVLVSLIGIDFYATKQRYLEALMKGATLCLLCQDLRLLPSAVETCNVSVVYGTVFHVEAILALHPEDRLKFHGLKALMAGGSSASMEFRRRVVEQLCPNFHVLYGANECHTTCITRSSELLGVPGNVGRPHPGFVLDIVGPNGESLPVGETGLVRIKSDCSIDGYLNDPIATAERFKDGWFHPGDLGQLLPDGQVIFKGRADDLMIMNGINIYPGEIEYVLNAHPSVSEAVAFPVHHDVHQDVPVCVVVLREGSSVDERTLHRFAAERLASSCPRHLFIVEKIPLNDRGKPDRQALLQVVSSRIANARWRQRRSVSEPIVPQDRRAPQVHGGATSGLKVLLVIAHYFRPQEGAVHSSMIASARQSRQYALEQMLLWWRASMESSASLSIEHKKFVMQPPTVDQLDIHVLVNDEHHLLTRGLVERYRLTVHRVKTDQPKLLPFAAHRLMADRQADHDWFVYSEDDLVMRDSFFFAKQGLFQQRFGPGRVLQPHRFEINPQALRFKTYIDGDLRPGFIEPWLARVAEPSPRLSCETSSGPIDFVRARNPHSGCFSLTSGQVAHWSAQPHFMDLDCSFVSPLESAATGALLKTFSVFKPAASTPGFLEVEHMDRKFSNLKLPVLGPEGVGR